LELDTSSGCENAEWTAAPGTPPETRSSFDHATHRPAETQKADTPPHPRGFVRCSLVTDRVRPAGRPTARRAEEHIRLRPDRQDPPATFFHPPDPFPADPDEAPV